MTDLLILILQLLVLGFVAMDDFRSMEIRTWVLVLLSVLTIGGLFFLPIQKDWLIDWIPLVIFATSTILTSRGRLEPVTGAADWWMVGILCLILPFPESLGVLIGGSLSGLIVAKLMHRDRSPFAGWLAVWMIITLIYLYSGRIAW